MENNGYISLVENALQNYKSNVAFTDFEGDSFTYSQVADRIYWLHQIFKQCNIKKGDKIAIVGRNLSGYTISYIAIITYGAVIVPILPDFRGSEIHHIVNHSEAKLLLATNIIFNKIDQSKMDKLNGILNIVDFDVIANGTSDLKEIVKNTPLKENVDVNDITFAKVEAEELMVLSYTSGTSGFSKGVMLPHRSIWSNVQFAYDNLPLKSTDKIVSFLPLAHLYGCLFEFLWPFTMGVNITLLSRVPSPNIISEAMQQVKPRLILAVPLILEKIFKRKILPALERKSVKALIKVPIVNKLIYKKIRNQLMEAFGGEFHQIVVGGAALNKDVEEFLKKIDFPFTVGYGMTECGPLISYCQYDSTQLFSAGKLVDRMEVKIDSNDPYNTVGEILVKGDNTLLGYYKNPEATEQAFTPDGWLKTGDLGVIDENNFVFIKGRSKNMILGASGQNIYPEEVENVINNIDYVQECVVRDMGDGRLEALVYPDYELADIENLNQKQLESKINEVKVEANADLPNYMNVSKVVLFPEEFEKTPKKSIKRFKYVN